MPVSHNEAVIMQSVICNQMYQAVLAREGYDKVQGV